MDNTQHQAEIFSFPPIAAADAQILILGSMPGKASLAANQYYAHPRNQFWSILAELLGNHLEPDYHKRTEQLIANGIALWDVLKSCRRHGSLDADIDKTSIIANDFVSFLAEHPQIKQVYFNGATAEQSFHRYVLPTLKSTALLMHRLPSTSPAHAALDFQQKLQSWRLILGLSQHSPVLPPFQQ